ncbi:MAG: ABC transporter ATP-binding protein [Rhodobacteraceae bacterium]|nr:ABC transporter ATP-binding protein [Paracoccaceae bacterium]PHR53651.1 MAG: ABC transporter ATP-binding protein [Robiginitomaculum sp.]
MKAVSVKNASMHFGDFTAVQDVSFDVGEGEFITLLGPSGCGKTTLLKMISGFLQPSSGIIEIGGKDVTHVPPERRDTAMCFQSYALFPHLSVADNLQFGLKQKRLLTAERKQRLQDVATKLDLTAQLDKLPNQLSGGQQQRVALGRALTMRPSVVLFDEPLSNLDAKLRDSVRMEIRKIQRDYNLAAIYVTHDQGEALAMSDRILIMNNGRIEQAGTPHEIYGTPNTSFVADFIGDANILDAEVIGEEGAGRWRLGTQIGELIAASAAPPVAKTLKVCWRPEKAQFGPGTENTITADITHRAFQGNYTDLFVMIASAPQRVQWRDNAVGLADSLTMHIRPEDIIFLEAIA